jgi:hypothetical protein
MTDETRKDKDHETNDELNEKDLGRASGGVHGTPNVSAVTPAPAPLPIPYPL